MKVFSEESALQLSEMLLQNDKDIKTEIEGKIPSVEGLASEKYVDNAVKNVEVDLTGYATETYVNNAIANAQLSGGDTNVDLSGYATKDDLNDYATKEHTHDEYLTEHQDLSDYAKRSEIPTDYLSSIPDEYVTESEMNAAIENAQLSGGEVDLSTYYNKTMTDELLAEKADKDDIPNLEGYATEEYVNNAFDSLDFIEKEYADDDTIVHPMYYDLHVIPDKYNTGCDEATCTETLSAGLTSQGIAMRLDNTDNGDWLYIDFGNSSNKSLEGEYVFENLDLSGFYKTGVSNTPNYIGNGIKVVYNNCKFTNWVESYGNDKVQLEFNNCSFSRFSGFNSVFNNCYFGGGDLNGDPMNPQENCTFNNCYCSNCVVKTEEQGTAHIDGMQSNGCMNLYFNNCRWEVPDINYTYKQGGFSYVIYLEPRNGNVAKNCIFDHCHINGGGYFSISVTEDVDPTNNIRIIEPTIGYCYYSSTPYYPNNNNRAKEVTENAVLHDSLYISSVWKDDHNYLHFLATNDTGEDRTLSVYTNKGVITFEVPRNYKMTEYEVDTKDFVDLPIDIEHVIEENVDYAIFYEGSKQLRYVNYENYLVRKPIMSSCANGEDGKDGVTPTFEIGTVETLEAGAQATVSITGTAEKTIFNFGIPRGADGEDGVGGENNVSSEDITSAINEYFEGNPIFMEGYVKEDKKLVALCATNFYQDRYWNSTNKVSVESSQRTYLVLETPNGELDNQTIYISGATGGSSKMAAAQFLDGNNNEVGLLFESINVIYSDREFVVPEGTKFIYINGYRNNFPMIKAYKNIEFLTEVDVDYTLENGYRYSVPKSRIITGGRYSLQNNTITEMTLYSCAEYILNGEKKLKLYGSKGASVFLPFCTFVSEVGNILLTLDDIDGLTEDNTYEGIIVDVPEGAYKVYVGGNNYIAAEIFVPVQDSTTDLSIMPNVLTEFGEKLQYKDKFAWKEMDTGYFVFSYDDSNDGFEKIVDLFEEMGVPCVFGVIPKKLNFVTASGETILSAMLRCQENGGEILNHEHFITDEEGINDMEALYNKFVITKRYLKDCGLNVRGILRAGGDGNICNDPRTDVWVRLFYDDSDLYGIEEPYNHARYSSNGDLASFKTYVDEVIAKKEFCIFLFHNIKGLSNDTQGFTEEETRELISYIQEKGGKITNYAYVYDTFGTTVNELETENRLKALENIILNSDGNEVNY